MRTLDGVRLIEWLDNLRLEDILEMRKGTAQLQALAIEVGVMTMVIEEIKSGVFDVR